MNGIQIRFANSNDKPMVHKFIQTHFYPFEPLNVSLNAPPDPEDKESALEAIDHGVSLIAELDGKPVGILIQYPTYATDKEEPAVYPPVTNFDKVIGVLQKVADAVDIYKHYGVDKAMHCHILAVHNECRGKGLAKLLYQESLKVATNKGFKLNVCDCTSFFTSKLCKSLGMEFVTAINYTDFVDPSGVPYFKPPSPHVSCERYALILNGKSKV